MGGSSTSMQPSFQMTSQTQNRDPWGAAIPALNTALSGAQNAYNTTYNGPNVAAMDPNVTAGQDQILANSAGGLTSSGATSALGGLQGILSNLGLSGQQNAGANAISGAISNLSPMASGAMLDPTKDPNFSKALQDALDQTANSTNAQFSSAGRYGSGAQTDALGRALGATAANAYTNRFAQNEANMLAANAQTGGLASALAGIGQQGIGNLFGAGGALSGLSTAQNTDAANRIGVGGQRMDYAQQLIDAANQAPWTKVGNLAQIASGIGGLGGTSTTQGTSFGMQPVQNNQPSTLQTILGGAAAGLGFASKFSDERLKENLRKIGRTNDGQNLYLYNYKADPLKRPEVGLLAQEVERKRPDAVTMHSSGYRMVDYGKALGEAA